MKKLMMMVAMLAVSFAMQAQTKFHDVELNEAKGAVKCIKSNQFGQDIVINFTEDGKMSQEGMSEAKYDADGYLQSAKMTMMGNVSEVTFKWDNGRVVGQKMNPIPYPIKDIAVYVIITAILTWPMIACQHRIPMWAQLLINTLLIGLFLTYIIKKDFPLSSLPVIGKKFKK